MVGSNLADILLRRLKDAQVGHALDSLRNPGMKTEFEFGYRCGTIAGIDFAINLLLATLDEERGGEPRLSEKLQ